MTNPPQAQVEKSRPGSVTTAVWIQLLLAVFLLVSAVASFIYGPDAQEAFDAELARQGAELPGQPVNLDPGAAGLAVSVVIAGLIVLLALLNGAGNRVARVLTWIFQPLVFICGGFLFVSQMFLPQFTEMGIEASDESVDENLDVSALFDAAFDAFPAWTTAVDWIVLVLATLGSILVIILLAVPSAGAYFRKEEPQQHIPGAPPQ